ncbi:MAG: hypothetical protein AUJ47_03575 [Candidatus Marinimicrobia bacterium CG1_02_48_14]|nr:MAG: hypothetical protein AUJ47_03575 [Candidatus Marinimicrobia bacterium CG1_02_48_14]
MRRFFVLGYLLLLGAATAFAATVGTIAGTVVDDVSGTPLPGVNVLVVELGIGGSSDLSGDYYIENVPVGRYTVKATMIGYKAVTTQDVRIIMDQTARINIRMEESFVQGQEVVVTAERPMVDKDVTVKKMVRTAEEIQNLPVRDLTEMLTLQSGIIQVKSAEYGIPGFEDRGIEQIHVRGGRSGEIGYTIDGMYIENPIYGGIGKGTRINKYAVRELEVQTGVFSAEYGDAMSSIVNNISFTGGADYEAKLTLEGSNLGPVAQQNDRLRNYQKIAGRFSGPVIPGSGDKFTFSISGDMTTGAYRVLNLDDKVYDPNNIGGQQNNANAVNWLDRNSGFRSFGFDDTYDVFTKLHWRIDNYKQMNLTYWFVNSEFKVYDRNYQYYEEGKNVNRKWSERWNLEFRQQLNKKTYYTISAARFTQQMKMSVENGDMDGDGYPDWVEFKAGTEARGLHMGQEYHGECDIPFINKENPGATITADSLEKYYQSWGPGCIPTKIKYFARDSDADPYDAGTEMTIPVGEPIVIGKWDKVKILDNSLQSFNQFRNGYLIIPLDSMEYTDDRGESRFWHYGDPMNQWLQQGQYASVQYHTFPDSTYDLYFSPPTGVMTAADIQAMRDSLYYIYYYEYFSGGADRYRHWTKSVTDEIKIDLTSRINKNHQLRGGIDFKRHFITFDEAQLPWLADPYVEVYGLPDSIKRDNWLEEFLYGTGEKMPLELGAYVQDKIEYPWMTINVGLRVDMQNSQDTSWADPRASWSGLTPSDWKILWSPRLGISHVITDRATFTFGYGRFYQNPTYRNIYLNDQGDLTTASPIVGNAHVQAEKASAYEFGLNYQFADFWRLGLVGWSKDYSDLASTERVKAFPYNYSVVVNYDYGSARGLDLTLEKRGGSAWSMVVQYTLSRATANRADAWQGYRNTDTPESMPKKEVLMNYDRTHNITTTAGYFFDKKNNPMILGIRPLSNSNVNFTLIAMSGAPYTPYDINLSRYGATNSQRMPWYIEANLAYRKFINLMGVKWSAGVIVRNVFNFENVIDIYEETGSATDPGRLNEQAINDGALSTTYFDRPYYFSDPRQIDVTLEASF